MRIVDRRFTCSHWAENGRRQIRTRVLERRRQLRVKAVARHEWSLCDDSTRTLDTQAGLIGRNQLTGRLMKHTQHFQFRRVIGIDE